MEAEVYPNPTVADYIVAHFVPVKIQIKEQKPMFERFNALWTPTQVFMDPEGVERHRIEGFLPIDDFLAQLELGLGKIRFQKQDYADAERRFRTVCDMHPQAGAAAEACYWAGVAAYKSTHDAGHLAATARILRDTHPDSEWARKASVWEQAEQPSPDPPAASTGSSMF